MIGVFVVAVIAMVVKISKVQPTKAVMGKRNYTKQTFHSKEKDMYRMKRQVENRGNIYNI